MTDLPRIRYLAFGGTIASVPREGSTELIAKLTGDDIVASVPRLAAVARVEVVDFPAIPSFAITLSQMAALAEEVKRAFDSGFDGVVISHGTDTIEETAYALALMVPRECPVVLTGAMRGALEPGADGPANLLAAFRVAVQPEAAVSGPLVVLDDSIHAARFVTKIHTSRTSTFESPGAGPVGELVEGRVELWWRPTWKDFLALPSAGDEARVELIRIAVDCDDTLFRAAAAAQVAGIVIEGTGGGHVPPRILPAIDDLIALGIPLVIASRVAAGANLEATYRNPGAETDLIDRGLIPAGNLRGNKARLRLLVGLRAGLAATDLFPVR